MEATVLEAARAMGGRLVDGRGEALWRGVAIDSRRVAGGELFFALAGERTDGHRFVDAALAAGAVAAVVEHQLEPGTGPLIRVEDTFAALHDLTRAMRRRTPDHVVGITGSAGKTTTKDLLTAMLANRYRVAGSPGNLNNLYGFPLALLGIPDDTEWMVAEMGMSTPGELGGVSRLGRPDVAVFTNVRAVHLEGLGSLRGVAEAKRELLEGLSPEGVVVANADDPEVRWIAEGHPGRVVWYSRQVPTDSMAGPSVSSADGTRFLWTVAGLEREVHLALHGDYNVWNFLAAATCAHHLGVPAADVVATAARARPAGGRGVVHRLHAGITVVDDSYNSNPAALAEALRSAAALPGERHWAVLGDMLELGEDGERFHREAGAAAARAGFSPILGVGEASRTLVAAATEAGSEASWYVSAEEAAAALPALAPADVVLVKGSRGVGLERVVRELTESGGEG